MKRLTTGLLLTLSLLLSISCANPTSAVPTNHAPAPLQEQPPRRSGGGGQIDWAFSFDNLSDLTAFSDVIAIVVVDKAIEVTHEKGMLYSTRWALRVEKVLKGRQSAELIVYQFGSPDQPGSDMSDDPLFLPRERYLLFLREGTPGTYGYFGPWGRYLLWNNRVYSMNHILLAPGAANYRTGELNYAGADMNTLAQHIVELADSVQLIFTQGLAETRADVVRYPAGTTVNIDATLSTGKYGPGKVTLAVDRARLPEGLVISMEPVEFTAYPWSEYKSRLTIAPDIPPGTYEIPVEYSFDGVGAGRRVITFHVASQ